jgi:hypothetical protein
MVRKTCRRQPEFETMETLVLLSGASIVGQHGVAALVARGPHVTGPIVLMGTVNGTYKADEGLKGPIRFDVKDATVHPLGKASVKGSVQVGALGFTGSSILRSLHGAVFTNLSTSGPGSLLIYTITGGSGKFAGATGHGVASFTTTPSRSGPDLGKFTLTFMNSTS